MDWEERFLGAVCFLFVVLVIVLIGMAVFTGVDSIGVSTVTSPGMVINKYHVSEIYTEDYTYPERWMIVVQVDDFESSADFSKEFYRSVEIGQKVKVTYGQGRLNSNNVYIKSLSRD